MAPVWSTNLLGGSEPGLCIPDGPFANMRVTLPTPHCVRRGFTARTRQGMGSIRLEEPSVLAELVSGRSNYSTFNDALEFAHGAVHVAVGGALLDSNQGDMHFVRTSPNDPAFFVHHTYVDMLWADRQAAPGNAASDYGGTTNGSAVSAADALAPFGAIVRDSFSLPCVTYAPAGPAATGRSGRPTAHAAPLSRPDAENLVQATNGQKVWAMETFARQNGVPEAGIQRKKAALAVAEVEATMKGNTAAAAGEA